MKEKVMRKFLLSALALLALAMQSQAAVLWVEQHDFAYDQEEGLTYISLHTPGSGSESNVFGPVDSWGTDWQTFPATNYQLSYVGKVGSTDTIFHVYMNDDNDADYEPTTLDTTGQTVTS